MTDRGSTATRGLVAVMVGTVVAGLCGYLIQILAPALLTDPEVYLAFSVFWSTLYLFGTGLGGVQQEVARASRATDDRGPTRVLTRFTLLAIGLMLVLAVLFGWIAGPTLFRTDPVGLTVWLGVGLVGYLLLCTVSGLLYGVARYRDIAVLVSADAVLRGAAVTVALLLDAPSWVFAACVAVPFLPAVLLTVWLARAVVAGRYRLDVGLSRLSGQATVAAVAGLATGLMITGIPMLLGLAVPDEDPVVLAGLVLVVTLTRAPLIIPLMALQSFLIVRYRDAGDRMLGRVLRLMAALAGVGVLAAAAAWWLGPWVVDLISGGRFQVDHWVVAVVVVSGCLVAMLFLTGPALMASSRHAAYVGGWLLAATATLVLLFLPLTIHQRLATALLVPPLLGLAAHLLVLRRAAVTAERASRGEGQRQH